MKPGPRNYEFKHSPLRPHRNPNYGKPHDSRPPFNYGNPNHKPSFGNQPRPPMVRRPDFNNPPSNNRRPSGFGSNRSSTRVTQGHFPSNNREPGHFGGRR